MHVLVYKASTQDRSAKLKSANLGGEKAKIAVNPANITPANILAMYQEQEHYVHVLTALPVTITNCKCHSTQIFSYYFQQYTGGSLLILT